MERALAVISSVTGTQTARMEVTKDGAVSCRMIIFLFCLFVHSFLRFTIKISLDADNDPNAAGRCDYSNCTLPNCFCSVDGTLIPGNLEPNQVKPLD
jgi:hypothetical protein